MKLTESLLRRLIQEEINEMTGGFGGRGKVEPNNAGSGAGYQRDDDLARSKRRKKKIKKEAWGAMKGDQKKSYQRDDRHEEGEALLRKFQEEKPGAKPTEGELRRLADEMDLHDDAVSDAMGLAGYGKVDSDS